MAAIFFIFIFFSCRKDKKPKEGAVSVQAFYFDTTSLRYLPLKFADNQKYLYRDSFLIAFVNRIYFTTIDDSTRIELLPYKYMLIDMSKRRFYDYRHFSDTAACVDSFEYGKTKTKRAFGWDLFAKNTEMEIQLPPHPLPDTVIGGVRFKRVLGRSNVTDSAGQSFTATSVLYCASDPMPHPLQLNDVMSKKIGLPVLRSESEFRRAKTMQQIVQLSDSLTAFEQKVFDAWIKRAKATYADSVHRSH